MEPKDSVEGKLVEELQEIKTLLQNLLIIQGAKAGLNKSKVRELVGVANKRVTDVWQYIDFANND